MNAEDKVNCGGYVVCTAVVVGALAFVAGIWADNMKCKAEHLHQAALATVAKPCYPTSAPIPPPLYITAPRDNMGTPCLDKDNCTGYGCAATIFSQIPLGRPIKRPVPPDGRKTIMQPKAQERGSYWMMLKDPAMHDKYTLSLYFLDGRNIGTVESYGVEHSGLYYAYCGRDLASGEAHLYDSVAGARADVETRCVLTYSMVQDLLR